jgi:hypothetical protein
MASRKREIGPAERLAALAVLAVLCAAAAWLLARQSSPSPAVLASLQAKARPAAAKSADSALAGLVPQNAPGLSPLGPVETFGPETLSDKIDGKAELYLASGFKDLAWQAFAGAGGQGRVDLYLYEMASADAAFAVFSGQRRSDAHKSALAENAYTTQNALFFVHGPWYAELLADRADEGLSRRLAELAGLLLAGLKTKSPAPAAAEVKEGELFPLQGLVANTVRLSLSDVFGMEGLSNVYTAEYRLPRGEATAFLSRRASPEEAQKLAEGYSRFLAENGYREKPVGETPLHYRVFVQEASFEVVMTAGPLLAGVHDATSLAAAVRLADALAKALQGRTP